MTIVKTTPNLEFAVSSLGTHTEDPMQEYQEKREIRT